MDRGEFLDVDPHRRTHRRGQRATLDENSLHRGRTGFGDSFDHRASIIDDVFGWKIRFADSDMIRIELMTSSLPRTCSAN